MNLDGIRVLEPLFAPVYTVCTPCAAFLGEVMKAESEVRTPPYASYTSFRNYLDHLRQAQPLPSRIDKSVMAHLNYGTRQALMNALRQLGLLTKEDAPTQRLERLVVADDNERRTIMQEIVREVYPFMFNGSIDLSRATSAEFQEKLRSATGTQGSTAEKASAFFLSVAEEAGVTLSPHLTKRQVSAPASPRKARIRLKLRKPSKPAAASSEPPNAQQRPIAAEDPWLSKFPTFDPSWPDEIKAQWFSGFERLMASRDKIGG